MQQLNQLSNLRLQSFHDLIPDVIPIEIILNANLMKCIKYKTTIQMECLQLFQSSQLLVREYIYNLLLYQKVSMIWSDFLCLTLLLDHLIYEMVNKLSSKEFSVPFQLSIFLSILAIPMSHSLHLHQQNEKLYKLVYFVI